MIPRIVLTGGPCGGKTSTVRYIQDQLPKFDITPIVVPELATLLFNSGVKWLDVRNNEARAFQFQANMIKQQIANEDIFHSFAYLLPGKKVLVCDRGTIDNMVYAKDEWHEDILSQVGSLGYLKRRYDAIIHLNSLAHGEGYVLDNEARYETKDEAVYFDNRTYRMWAKGPEVFHERIPHNETLATKMDKVVEFIVEIVNRS